MKKIITGISLSLLFIVSCQENKSPLTTFEENMVGKYYIIEDDKLRSSYADIDWSQVFIELKKDRTFELVKSPVLRGSETGDWFYLDDGDIEFTQLEFDNGLKEQLIFSFSLDTLEMGYPSPVRGEKQMDKIFFYKEITPHSLPNERN